MGPGGRQMLRPLTENNDCSKGALTWYILRLFEFEPSGHAHVGNDDAIGPFDMRCERYTK
jgi:hypothetical protein